MSGAAPGASIGDARGIVEISRSTPRLAAGVAFGVAFGEAQRRAKKPGFEGCGVVRCWSIVLESQLASLRVGLGGVPWKGGLEAFDFSHAARVEASTGHDSAPVSSSLTIVMRL